MDAARQYCDDEGHNCDPSIVFIGALYGQRGAGGTRCPAALFEWWTDGVAAAGNRALAGPVPDNYIVVDTSLTGATTSLTAGGSMASWTDAWMGSGRPSFFYFDPSLTLVEHLSGSTLGGDYSTLASRTAPIFEAMAAAWTGCVAGDTYCDEVPAAGGETIMVGGDRGWVVNSGNAAYEDIIANVGDTLVFTYNSFYHDVMLVDNENCDFSSGTMVDETGDFSWTIPEPGTYIFACTRGSHCSSGNQQVTVIVAGDAAEPAAPCGDVDSSGIVDVNDLLILLSQFGSEDPGSADTNYDGVVDVNDLLLQLSQFGGSCEGVGEAAAAAPCAMGTDCGGQVWNDCGTSCPAVCGTAAPMMCNMMCNAAFQCTAGQCFNEATGACEAGAGR